MLRWIALTWLILIAPVAPAQQLKDAEHPEGEWEILNGCRLATNAVVDGDSFHVAHKGREYIFRLYFVDAPEADAALTERATDQAAYFGVAIKDIPRGGKLATEFTRAKLAEREFTIITRWRNGLGRSKLVRFYGVALVNGENLAEALVANGWARIYGLKANWPDGPRSTTFINKLRNLELGAREKRLGMWNAKEFTPSPLSAAGSQPIAAKAKKGSIAGVDLNDASFEELQTLPGIGPKLAEGIMANRPYQTVEELIKVNGIGGKTMERLRPLVRVRIAKSDK